MKRFEEVFLNDGRRYVIDNRSIVETACDAQHGDWKAFHTPIPQGTQLQVREVWRNFYGVWVEVLYNGLCYDLDPCDLKYVGRT